MADHPDQHPGLVVRTSLLCMIRHQDKGQAMYFWQNPSFHAPRVPAPGSTVNRRMRG
jgi:hypothetical protein